MNCGQVCICNERTLVQKTSTTPSWKPWSSTRGLRLGDPHGEDTEIGTKISAPELEKVEAFVAAARNGGAKVALGGERPSTPPVEAVAALRPARRLHAGRVAADRLVPFEREAGQEPVAAAVNRFNVVVAAERPDGPGVEIGSDVARRGRLALHDGLAETRRRL